MKTFIHCKVDGYYRVFSINGYVTHEKITQLMKVDGIVVDGAVMLTYKKVKSV